MPGLDRFCGNCGAALPLAAAATDRRSFSDRFPRWSRYVAITFVLFFGGIVATLYYRGAGIPGLGATTDPLAGTIVFGDSFDDDLVLRGPRKTASLSGTTVWVAHVREPLRDGSVVLHHVLDGSELVAVPMTVEDGWTLLGATLSTLGAQPGQVLLLKLTTVGNELIAIGSVTIEP